ncbi:hypothetical protein NDU88_002018 [Pleurodeles waltl]|uniref:Uncharacterized protein n=1 Tax=Pleurodeles waltl TaxID=8319 RepID=A0AAV7LES6_PLEWA|nr:hypothetical protein NDU88_002018 [Pleurodeles waltl]
MTGTLMSVASAARNGWGQHAEGVVGCVARHWDARISLPETRVKKSTPGAPPGITQKRKTEGTQKSETPQSQKTDFQGGLRWEKRTQRKRRDSDVHQQPTAEERDKPMEEDSPTRGKEAQEHSLTAMSLEGHG